jgi:hypothetical protein
MRAVKHAVGVFANDTYEDERYDDHDGTELGRVHITRRFSGEIEGQGTAELLTARTPDGFAAYVGLDRIAARIDGRSGTFVLQHWGTVSSEGATTAGSVVPGSGTGALEGLRGEARIAVDEEGTHTLELDYELIE